MASFRILSAALLAVALVQSASESGSHAGDDWPTYSGTWTGSRYSGLTDIHAGNVSRLRLAWIRQADSVEKQESTPIVVGGVMYITEAPDMVRALDPASGKVFWTYRRSIPSDLRLCCGPVNRGVAVEGDLVYYASIDAHLIALDRRTGRPRWDVAIADYRQGYSSTAAPLTANGLVITGIAGGEYGIRGFLDAYNARTGERVWRFHTIPAPGQPGSETWSGDSWKTGGGPTWITGAYDSETDTVFWGVGNPGPDWNGDARSGDNLYTNSVLALDARSGKLRWHFQFTPHDTHDWDATQTPAIAKLDFGGKPRKVLMAANKNGFYYVLDAANGAFLRGTPYVKQTWAEGLDDNGRPILKSGQEPSETGTLVWPSLDGGANWYSPSFHPGQRLFYVPVREQGAWFLKSEATYKPGLAFVGGGQRASREEQPYGAVRALDAETGKLRWEFRTSTPMTAGILSTAGDIVFSGTQEGDLFALHAATGKLLWTFPAGGKVIAAPVTFRHLGHQYIAVAAGHSIMAFRIYTADDSEPVKAARPR